MSFIYGAEQVALNEVFSLEMYINTLHNQANLKILQFSIVPS